MTDPGELGLTFPLLGILVSTSEMKMSENLQAVVVRMSPTQVVLILLACSHIGRGQGKGKRQVCRGKDKTIFKVKSPNLIPNKSSLPGGGELHRGVCYLHLHQAGQEDDDHGALCYWEML